MEYVVREIYDNLHNAITIEELQWMLRKAKRHTALYTILLLGVTTGMRCDELIKLQVNNVRNFKHIIYSVDKPKTTRTADRIEMVRKHRCVELDPWVGRELQAYFELNLGKVPTSTGVVYYSQYHDTQRDNKIFNWKNSASFDAQFFKLRRSMREAGFPSDRMEKLTTWHIRHSKRPTYVVRFHQLRHFYASVMFYRFGKDIKAVQREIKHTRSQTTDGYIHCAGDMNTTEQFLIRASWSEICGYGREYQLVLGQATTPNQCVLNMY